MNYKELNALPASAFTNPENFKTRMDSVQPQICKDNYQRGLKLSHESKSISISISSVWSSVGKDGSNTSSYEGIGYHTGTSELLRGFLDGPAQVIVYRLTDDGCKGTVIRKGR